MMEGQGTFEDHRISWSKLMPYDFHLQYIYLLGTLEEQLATIGLFAHEVANKGGHDLKKVEDLGQILEEHLILDNR